jgi:acyl carrier protein
MTIFDEAVTAMAEAREWALKYPESQHLKPIEKNAVKQESLFHEDFEMDDAEMLAFLLNFVENTGINLPDDPDAIDQWRTVGDFVDYVMRQTPALSSPPPLSAPLSSEDIRIKALIESGKATVNLWDEEVAKLKVEMEQERQKKEKL